MNQKNKKLITAGIILVLIVWYFFGKSGSKFFDFKQNSQTNSLIDLNGDGKSEIVLWNFYNSVKGPVLQVVDGKNLDSRFFPFGNIGDIPILGDFDGDGKSDFGFFKYDFLGCNWKIKNLNNTVIQDRNFGEVGDIPIPSDYDGDGKTDLVVYRPRNSGFYGELSGGKLIELHFGITGDIPVPKDYDGDGKADIATYRPAKGIWSIRSSRNGLIKNTTLGGPSYLPIPSDYDGDKKADFAVWSIKDNECKIIFSSLLSKRISQDSIIQETKRVLSNRQCFPLPQDLNGSGKSDLIFWDFNNNTLIVFKLNGIKISSQTKKINSDNFSVPVNNYILMKYIRKLIKPEISVTHLDSLTNIITFNKNGFFCRQCNFNEDLKAKIDKSEFESAKTFLADFDGDFLADPCIWSKKSNQFLFLSSKSGELQKIVLGGGVPILGHFNLDNVTDLGVYDLSSGKAKIAILNPEDLSMKEFLEISPGSASKIIIQDFNGDFIDDFGLYNSSDSVTVSFINSNMKKAYSNFGLVGDLIYGDYDGDGRCDIAKIDLNNNLFRFVSSVDDKPYSLPFISKLKGRVITPDIDLDFKSDFLIYNADNSIFGVLNSSDSYRYNEFVFGEKNSNFVNDLW